MAKASSRKWIDLEAHGLRMALFQAPSGSAYAVVAATDPEVVPDLDKLRTLGFYAPPWLGTDRARGNVLRYRQLLPKDPLLTGRGGFKGYLAAFPDAVLVDFDPSVHERHWQAVRPAETAPPSDIPATEVAVVAKDAEATETPDIASGPRS